MHTIAVVIKMLGDITGSQKWKNKNKKTYWYHDNWCHYTFTVAVPTEMWPKSTNMHYANSAPVFIVQNLVHIKWERQMFLMRTTVLLINGGKNPPSIQDFETIRQSLFLQYTEEWKRVHKDQKAKCMSPSHLETNRKRLEQNENNNKKH